MGQREPIKFKEQLCSKGQDTGLWLAAWKDWFRNLEAKIWYQNPSTVTSYFHYVFPTSLPCISSPGWKYTTLHITLSRSCSREVLLT